MQTSLSFLAHGRNQVRKLLMRIARYGKSHPFAYTGLCCALLCASGHAYTVVQISSGAPQGTETQFLAQTAAQFNAKVTPNPLASNTYAVTIYGPNPNYLPPLTSAQLLQQIDLDAQYMATVDSYTYTNGWADGVDYQQYQDVNTADQMVADCNNPAFWNVPIDTPTCVGVASIISQAIFNEHFSTPTVVPGDFQ